MRNCAQPEMLPIGDTCYYNHECVQLFTLSTIVDKIKARPLQRLQVGLFYFYSFFSAPFPKLVIVTIAAPSAAAITGLVKASMISAIRAINPTSAIKDTQNTIRICTLTFRVAKLFSVLCIFWLRETLSRSPAKIKSVRKYQSEAGYKGRTGTGLRQSPPSGSSSDRY